MKKLLVILMALAGFSAYAVGPLSLKNSTGRDLAAECFPSKTFCNGIGDRGTCTCSDTDTVIYFGRTSVPQTQDQLKAITDYSDTFDDGWYSDYHTMGNGKVWELFLNTSQNVKQVCTLEGDPNDTVDCFYAF